MKFGDTRDERFLGRRMWTQGENVRTQGWSVVQSGSWKGAVLEVKGAQWKLTHRLQLPSQVECFIRSTERPKVFKLLICSTFNILNFYYIKSVTC